MSTNHRYYLLNKPYGYVSQFVSRQAKAHKKQYLGELGDFPEGTMAVGRLDEPSEGLLILTTDGKFSDQIRSKSVEKEYWLQLDGIIDEPTIDQLSKGVEISINGKVHQSLPARVERIEPPENIPERKRPIRSERHGPTSWLSIIINEGKFRQLRKMTASVGFPTLRLIRYRIGEYHLNEIESGKYKEFTLS